MNFIQRVMRAMTHLNIGMSLGLVAWVLWSGWQSVAPPVTFDEPASTERLSGLFQSPGANP